MKKQTTIRINVDQLPWIKKCCEKYNMGTADFIEEFEKQTRMKKLQAFYNSLPMPTKFVKTVKKLKSKPCKICIQKGMAS